MLAVEGPTMFGNYLIETAHTNYDSDVSAPRDVTSVID